MIEQYPGQRELEKASAILRVSLVLMFASLFAGTLSIAMLFIEISGEQFPFVTLAVYGLALITYVVSGYYKRKAVESYREYSRICSGDAGRELRIMETLTGRQL